MNESGGHGGKRPFIFSNGFLFSTFTRVATVGGQRPLVETDIPTLPRSQLCFTSLAQLRDKIDATKTKGSINAKETPFQLSVHFFYFIWKFQYISIINLNLIKLAASLMSFANPILLGLFVDYFDEAKDVPVWRGVLLLLALMITQVISAVLSCQFTILASKLETQMKGALMLAVFRSALATKMHDMRASELSNALVINAMQIDIERSVETVKSFSDLWEIPLQMLIAFALLYLQVDFAFIAGVVVSIVVYDFIS